MLRLCYFVARAPSARKQLLPTYYTPRARAAPAARADARGRMATNCATAVCLHARRRDTDARSSRSEGLARKPAEEDGYESPVSLQIDSAASPWYEYDWLVRFSRAVLYFGRCAAE